MNEDAERTAKSADQPGSLLALALLSLVVGAAAGLLGALFRLALAQARQLFFMSIIYLPLLLGLMVLDKVKG